MKNRFQATIITLLTAASLVACHAHEKHGHSHDHDEPGPNGGRVLHDVNPHVEFLVTDGRKVRLTFLSDDLKKAVALAGQTVTAVAGDRAAPTNLKFAPDGDSLLSDVALPKGDEVPIVLSFKMKPDAKTVRVSFSIKKGKHAHAHGGE